MEHRSTVDQDEIWVYQNRNGWFARADYACGGPYKTEEEARVRFPEFLTKVRDARSECIRCFRSEGDKP